MLVGSVEEFKAPEKETVFMEDLPPTETFSGLFVYFFVYLGISFINLRN